MPKKKSENRKLPTRYTEQMLTGQKKEVWEQPIAFVIKDNIFGEFEVKNSANAWWISPEKMNSLITVFKMDGTVEEACSCAGISKKQYGYFIELHPNFRNVIEICREIPILKARKRVFDGLDESYGNAMDYLKRKRKKEFSERQEISGPDGERLFDFGVEGNRRINKYVDDLPQDIPRVERGSEPSRG